MKEEFESIPGLLTATVAEEDLQVDRAKAVALSLSSAGHGRLVECQVVTANLLPFISCNDEIVIYDADIDVGQRPVNDIWYTERLAILFPFDDRMVPLVFALRSSFPRVMHLISMPFEKPSCLCIYDLPWDHLKLGWRPIKFIEDIRYWLARTADNMLHQEDQPLEPLLLQFYGQLIIPSDIQQGESLYLHLVSEQRSTRNFLALRKKQTGYEEFQVLIIDGQPQEHGIIDHSPNHLQDLNRFLKKAGIDLVEQLKKFFDTVGTDPDTLKKRLLVLVSLPKSNAAKTMNGLDYYAFIVGDNNEQIVLALNMVERGPTGLGRVVFPDPVSEDILKSVTVWVMVPHLTLSREMAQYLSSGELIQDGPVIVQIGAGALGSQLVVNLGKAGFGKWTIVDDDILLPHNTVRHYLDQRFLGAPKSLIMANVLNSSFQDGVIADGIFDNYLSPQDKSKLDQALGNADVILDSSASVPVARDIAQRQELKAKRISLFLNPKGTDLILLGEDKNRQYPLDVLEYQYYRALLFNEALSEHLQSSDRVRYAMSCRDITSRIPQDLVALHSAIGAKEFRKYAATDQAQITLWHACEDFSVQRIDVPVVNFKVIEAGDWKVYIDDYLIEKISYARLDKLPNETGGILIGGHDFHRKIIYLVDTILSPPDSEESPTGYVRGIAGVQAIMEAIQNKTADHLRYAGEWHSHPEKFPPILSEDDAILYVELKGKMETAGLPTLMMIAADNQQIAVYMD